MLITILLALLPVSHPATSLQEGAGLATAYPGDHGIAADPRVVFSDDFETGSVDEVGRRWGEMNNKDGKVVSFSADSPAGSGGKRALQLTATLSQNTGGHLYTRLKRGLDTAYVRFYVKFADDPGYIHHFVHVGGYNPPTNWPQGGAGERPRGDERMTAGIEPTGDSGRYPAPGIWNFYAYWQEMKRSADGGYWGQSIRPEKPAVVPRNRWQCVEVMFKCNSAPDRSDGELALWLDGKLNMHVAPGVRRGPWTGMGFNLPETGGEPFEGFRWRSTNDLKVNFLWLLHYVTEASNQRNHDAHAVNRVWFDNVVVATSYIGPIRPLSK
jgi:hypothetical protein